MPRTGGVVPYGADQTIYLVVDRLARLGNACRETEIERTDFETIIDDFLSGQFNDPVRVHPRALVKGRLQGNCRRTPDPLRHRRRRCPRAYPGLRCRPYRRGSPACAGACLTGIGQRVVQARRLPDITDHPAYARESVLNCTLIQALGAMATKNSCHAVLI